MNENKTKPLLIIKLVIILMFITGIGNPASHGLHAIELMKVSQIKPGMKGEGKTIFKGTRSETFNFTVLGIIEKFAPKKDLIIVELDAPALEGGGIIAGMSGSPAYIDGKLIGAVAYGFSFSRKPIGGITPIEDIIEISDHNRPPVSVDTSSLDIRFDPKNMVRVADFVRHQLMKRINFSPIDSFTPIRLMGSHRGFSPTVLSSLKPMFALSGSVKPSSPIDPKAAMADMNVLPADAVAIPLISGDFEFTSTGTVTHVDGNAIYMFGHPFFNLGSVDFPLHKAEIISVVPSYDNSFKMAATRSMVGRVVQDRYSAVQGYLGQVPYMIPMKVFLKNRNRQFNIELVSHSLLTPVLSAVAMSNIFASEYMDFGFQSIQVSGKIYIEGERNIIIDDLYSGADSFSSFSNLLMGVNFFLMNNKEKAIKIQKLDFEVSGSESVRIANIENVLVDKRVYLPGEVMNIVIYLRNEKGKSFTEKLSIKAPNLKAATDFYLLVADNTEMGRFDSKNIRSNYFPMKLNFLIRAINNLRKNNRLYLRMMTASGGLFVKGYEYPNLPGSIQKVFTYDQSTITQETSPGDQARMKYSTITEYQVAFPSVVRGKKLFKLKIKERSDGK